MVANNPQPRSIHPFQVVLLAFEFLNVPANGSIEKQGLIQIMLNGGCPRPETAEQILLRMTEEGLLEKIVDPQAVEAYARTPKGVTETLRLPPRPAK